MATEIQTIKASQLAELTEVTDSNYIVVTDGATSKKVKATNLKGNSLTSAQAQQLNTAYTHSQSSHVNSEDLTNINSAVNLNSEKITRLNSEVNRIDNTITGLSEVARSGLYSDLTGKPTKLSEFENDIQINAGGSYTLPIATKTTLGGVKIGNNLSIDSNGVLSATSNSEEIAELNSQMDKTVKFKVIGEGVSVPPISGGSSTSYVHPATHPASMITGLSTVATSGRYNDLTNKPTIPTVTNDLTNGLKSNYDTAYTHSQSAHAPSNAQKNSDITKTEIEAKLTGNITTHTHSQYLTEHQSLTGYATKIYVNDAIANASIGGEVDLSGYAKKSELSTVATSGSYNDLTNKPTIPTAYNHPTSHPASMITGLSKVATSGSYADLIGKPTIEKYTLPIASSTTLGGVKIGANLSIDSNGVLSAIVNNNGAISNTLDNYNGATLNDKMVAMFNDINTNHKNTPMVITLPSGIIEITQDLTAIGWTNKIFKGECLLYFKNCNAIEFKQCQHNDIYIHRVSSAIPSGSSNPQGFIEPNAVANLTKRGIKITDCSYNKFEFNTILGFTNAIEIYSEYGALGSFYNNIYFTAIWRCQRPMWFRTGKASGDTSSQSGWITEIFVHGGMFDCDDGVLIGQEVNQRPANEPSDNYQGLKFYNIGIEHVRKKGEGVGIYFLQGKSNVVINPRFEGSLLTGSTISGAYILVKESGYACNNRIETSNYPINIDRVQLNYSAKQLANPNYDNPAGSYIEGDLYDNSGFRCGYKAIATPGKMVYEAKNLSNYYLNNCKNNTVNFTYADTEYAKVKCSDGTIKSIGYTS